MMENGPELLGQYSTTPAEIAEDAPFVLFADDDPDILRLFELLARFKGWRADVATNAREIIAKVNYHCSEVGQCYDAIVTDVNFMDNQPGPRLTGITAIGEIRKRWSHIPVVVYSAYLNTVMRDQIKALGNTEAIEKLGRAPYGVSADVAGVVERVEAILQWTEKARTREGVERRREQRPGSPHRRASDCQGEVSVSQSLESVVTEARALRELHVHATAGTQPPK